MNGLYGSIRGRRIKLGTYIIEFVMTVFLMYSMYGPRLGRIILFSQTLQTLIMYTSDHNLKYDTVKRNYACCQSSFMVALEIHYDDSNNGTNYIAHPRIRNIP